MRHAQTLVLAQFGSGAGAGDSVVVPGKTDCETGWNPFVCGLKDWIQILSNFGLTAAAIHTLQN